MARDQPLEPQRAASTVGFVTVRDLAVGSSSLCYAAHSTMPQVKLQNEAVLKNE